ncbi:MAG: thioredoxin [Oscillospiraceae bacterium]|jgi:thioredoxin 1|nr:thioredoxin [Oscillospiraceae bacterium]
MPVVVRAKNFAAEVLEASKETPVLVDFFGERCMPCRMLRPVLLQIAAEYAGQLKVCMLNTDKEAAESDEEYQEKFKIILTYNVMNLPTMLLFAEGKLQRTLIGLHTKAELLDIFAAEGLQLTPREPEEDDAGDSKNS